MSVWQFTAAVEGFAKKQAGTKNQLSDAEKDDIWEWMNAGAEIVAREPKLPFNPDGVWPFETFG